MSNPDKSELKHNLEVNLIVDCGDHQETIPVPNYPALTEQRYQGVGTPATPGYLSAMQYKEGGATWTSISLFTPNDIALELTNLEGKLSTIMRTAIVNDKQRQAVEQLISEAVAHSKNLFILR